MSHTELIELNEFEAPKTVTAYSRTIVHKDDEYRLVYHTEFGFGLQCRPDEPFEDWVDVECMPNPERLAAVITSLLVIGLEDIPRKD